MILQSIRMLVFMTVLTGVAYPLLVTGIAQVIFPKQANGSLIEKDGKVLGSSLIGQPFSDPKYFWSRASATSPMPYNGGSSSGSNQGPTNPALKEAVEGRVKALRDAGSDASKPCRWISSPRPAPASTRTSVPLPPTTRSPEWRRSAAWLRRKCRSSSRRTPRAASFGFLGEPRVNVLRLNLALDATK